MAAPDVNSLFASAEAALAAGRLDEARKALNSVLGEVSGHPAVFHLRAMVEKRGGDFSAADQAFRTALALLPGDPQINNNYANLLDELGDSDAALLHYDRALSTDPAFADARFNRALLLQRLDRTEEALRELDTLLAANPQSARSHSARGAALRRQGRIREAAAAYDAVLALSPTHLRALAGRARVALEGGEAGASAHFRRALAALPSDPELLLGLAEALEAEGDPQALPFLEGAVAAHPQWVEGQERLAEMRSENGDEGHFARGYPAALAIRPGDRALHYSHWRALAMASCHAEALDAMAAARPNLAEDHDMQLMEAVFLSEAGDPARGADLLSRLGDEPEIALAHARALLRLGEAGRAVYRLEQVIAAQPGNIAAWAHLGLAWRLTGDPRHEWLCGQAGLHGPIDLALGNDGLARLAEVLRALHRTRSHPIGQSLRNGTQTRGNLLWRSDPEIVALKDALTDAIGAYVARLPPPDSSHPLLRHRNDRFEIGGSWSVRLAASGFHIHHIHPQGILSSACYIALPESLGDETDRAGWLELGASPVELGLGLEPIASIEPRPGRLALFPSYLYHGTRPFSAGERLTVAFDVVAR